MAVQTVDVNAPGMGRCVRVTVVADDTPSVVVLRPSHARAMSAAMLNAADLADGTTPLQFTPAEVAS